MTAIRARALRPLIDIIRHFNLVLEELIEPLGIDINTLLHPKYEDKIEIEKAYALFERVATQTQCNHVGALTGSREKLSFLGPIGLLMQHSVDVETALKVMLKHIQVQQNLVECHFNIFEQNAQLTLTIYCTINSEGARHFVEGCLFSIAKILQLIIGVDFIPNKICLAHKAPEGVLAYRRLAKTQVSFSEEEYAIVFDANYLTRPTKQYNEELSQTLTNYLALLKEQPSNDLLTRLGFTIQRQLRDGSLNLQSVAEELHIHPRNLQRQLKLLGTSFSELLIAYRSRLAIELIKDQNLQITQIAHRLGYSDSTAFGQAFKKWFNKMPRAYRNQLLATQRGIFKSE